MPDSLPSSSGESSTDSEIKEMYSELKASGRSSVVKWKKENISDAEKRMVENIIDFLHFQDSRAMPSKLFYFLKQAENTILFSYRAEIFLSALTCSKTELDQKFKLGVRKILFGRDINLKIALSCLLDAIQQCESSQELEGKINQLQLGKDFWEKLRLDLPSIIRFLSSRFYSKMSCTHRNVSRIWGDAEQKARHLFFSQPCCIVDVNTNELTFVNMSSIPSGSM